MAEKPVPLDQESPIAARSDKPERSEEDYRLLCRRYSRFRSRLRS
jgi:hypothetical protein